MQILFILLAVAAGLVLLAALIAYICFRMAFYVPRRSSPPEEEIPLPQGKIYEPFWDTMTSWTKETRALPHEDVSITSFDGLTLRGRYYQFAPGSPIELMFHGYRSSSERDLCGGVQRCFKLGRSALIVDQRASGCSGGNVITFGIHERRDCHSWIHFMIEKCGPDVKIILTGISMGAATVLMAANEPLPQNVAGILADCGYSTAKDIIKAVIRQLKLPADLAYPFVKLGAKLYGHFDLEETTPEEAMKHCSVPVIFFHGEADDFVPCHMSRANYDACTSPKKLCTVPNASHGLSYLVDPEGYLSALREFFDPVLSQ